MCNEPPIDLNLVMLSFFPLTAAIFDLLKCGMIYIALRGYSGLFLAALQVCLTSVLPPQLVLLCVSLCRSRAI